MMQVLWDGIACADLFLRLMGWRLASGVYGADDFQQTTGRKNLRSKAAISSVRIATDFFANYQPSQVFSDAEVRSPKHATTNKNIVKPSPGARCCQNPPGAHR
eukprot:1158253-Pelagomonas_calceolata.AAC.1